METLPDVPLINVFSFVDTQTLLGRVRAVCRRWRALALAVGAWEHREATIVIHSHRSLLPMKQRILRVAPCVSSIIIQFKAEDFNCLDSIITQITCAARGVHLRFLSGVSTALVSFLRNQVALGRLQSLELDFAGPSGEFKDCETAQELVRIAAEIPLLKLSIFTSDAGEILELKLPWGSGTSKHLDIGCCSKLSDLSETILMARAESVESVDLSFTSVGEDYSLPVVRMLPRCVRLREVTMPAVLELPCLLECPCLAALTLVVCNQQLAECAVASVRILLAGATRLTNLKLEVICHGNDHLGHSIVCEQLMDMLKALASPGQSFLSALTVSYYPIRNPTSLPHRECFNGLPAVLQGLPRLETLEILPLPSVEALAAITNEMVPSLRRLRCRIQGSEQEAALVALVRKLPALHAEVDYEELSLKDESFGLFCHPAEQRCALHTRGYKWRELPPDASE